MLATPIKEVPHNIFSRLNSWSSAMNIDENYAHTNRTAFAVFKRKIIVNSRTAHLN